MLGGGLARRFTHRLRWRPPECQQSQRKGNAGVSVRDGGFVQKESRLAFLQGGPDSLRYPVARRRLNFTIEKGTGQDVGFRPTFPAFTLRLSQRGRANNPQTLIFGTLYLHQEPVTWASRLPCCHGVIFA